MKVLVFVFFLFGNLSIFANKNSVNLKEAAEFYSITPLDDSTRRAFGKLGFKNNLDYNQEEQRLFKRENKAYSYLSKNTKLTKLKQQSLIRDFKFLSSDVFKNKHNKIEKIDEIYTAIEKIFSI